MRLDIERAYRRLCILAQSNRRGSAVLYRQTDKTGYALGSIAGSDQDTCCVGRGVEVEARCTVGACTRIHRALVLGVGLDAGDALGFGAVDDAGLVQPLGSLGFGGEVVGQGAHIRDIELEVVAVLGLRVLGQEPQRHRLGDLSHERDHAILPGGLLGALIVAVRRAVEAGAEAQDHRIEAERGADPFFRQPSHLIQRQLGRRQRDAIDLVRRLHDSHAAGPVSTKVFLKPSLERARRVLVDVDHLIASIGPNDERRHRVVAHQTVGGARRGVVRGDLPQDRRQRRASQTQIVGIASVADVDYVGRVDLVGRVVCGVHPVLDRLLRLADGSHHICRQVLQVRRYTGDVVGSHLADVCVAEQLVVGDDPRPEYRRRYARLGSAQDIERRVLRQHLRLAVRHRSHDLGNALRPVANVPVHRHGDDRVEAEVAALARPVAMRSWEPASQEGLELTRAYADRRVGSRRKRRRQRLVSSSRRLPGVAHPIQ